MTILKNSLTPFSAILAATFSLLICPHASEAASASLEDGIALLNIDARTMSTEERPSIALLNIDARSMNSEGRPSIALLNIDARSMNSEGRPSIALLNIDARSMSTEERPSIALLNIDARSSEASNSRVWLDLDLIDSLDSEDGFFVEGLDQFSGARAFVPSTAIDDGYVSFSLNSKSTLGADVIDLLIDEGFDLAEIDTATIVGAARRVEHTNIQGLELALDAAHLGLYRYNNDACGADPTGIQGLADAICLALPE